ncbi:hypothetical protein IU500_18595 [Nocardia terpenica]|uniref:hypothetical protein n=1 Tax=Nocardia terpenica TaxID=455432 RepID=UPI00189607CA|nr:hypothetical protein [Nocardia terpenica]MBF6063496.1 hypothetical protein [Nocardia terpenica]MBF6106052.1 hypothetical protein [Nocardia terpenica]MBF6113363.1 hypothetical protein [Nocardia terpenica]MBF6119793.1 hypothetical protein [Nocardia terpenica]MBF6152204.1 hypothetical protein [Nocardia terpenica]
MSPWNESHDPVDRELRQVNDLAYQRRWLRDAVEREQLSPVTKAGLLATVEMVDHAIADGRAQAQNTGASPREVALAELLGDKRIQLRALGGLAATEDWMKSTVGDGLAGDIVELHEMAAIAAVRSHRLRGQGRSMAVVADPDNVTAARHLTNMHLLGAQVDALAHVLEISGQEWTSLWEWAKTLRPSAVQTSAELCTATVVARWTEQASPRREARARSVLEILRPVASPPRLLARTGPTPQELMTWAERALADLTPGPPVDAATHNAAIDAALPDGPEARWDTTSHTIDDPQSGPTGSNDRGIDP